MLFDLWCNNPPRCYLLQKLALVSLEWGLMTSPIYSLGKLVARGVGDFRQLHSTGTHRGGKREIGQIPY